MAVFNRKVLDVPVDRLYSTCIEESFASNKTRLAPFFSDYYVFFAPDRPFYSEEAPVIFLFGFLWNSFVSNPPVKVKNVGIVVATYIYFLKIEKF